MTLFDLSDYKLRQLDPQQGTKPLDFGGGGITGSVNLDGRLIAINTYHPEHGYITLTSIPPFPDEDRYDQQKVRAYRKSLVTNEGFGLQFEQDIIKREYYLIEDAVPFMRFTLEDGTIAECMTTGVIYASQEWRFSRSNIKAKYTGNVWLMRTAYTQLTEGGVLQMPSTKTQVDVSFDKYLLLRNIALGSFAQLIGLTQGIENSDGSINLTTELELSNEYRHSISIRHREYYLKEVFHKTFEQEITRGFRFLKEDLANISNNLIVKRATIYAHICSLYSSDHENTILTDHMILPLSWNRDAYYVTKVLTNLGIHNYYLPWLFKRTWRGTYCRSHKMPIADGWGRSYMANGQQKDSRSFQLDQQIFPLLTFADSHDQPYKDNNFGYTKEDYDRWQVAYKERHLSYIFRILETIRESEITFGLYLTDETPADDDIPLHLHFSSHILLWYALKRIDKIYPEIKDYPDKYLQTWMTVISENIQKHFITEHKGKKIYSYATDGEGNHYLYHDANDIPLVMMPLWGFCDKDDPIWRNTIDFGFSSDNPGFYDGVLGSVHTPAPWSLGDAQELILSKVIGDRARYQRVWERVEKAAQWDGALPEAYDANTFEVVSRHWFAWTNAMVAIADSISWDWETEGEYAR